MNALVQQDQPTTKATAGSSAMSTPAIDGFSRRRAWSSAPKPSTIAITATNARRASVARVRRVRQCDELMENGSVNQRGDRHGDRQALETLRSVPPTRCEANT